MWLLRNTAHYILDKALQFVSCGHKVQVTLFAWGHSERNFICILNHSAMQQLNALMTAIASLRTSQCGEDPMTPKRTKTKLLALCARSSYKACFEACFVDWWGPEKHNFLTALLENSRKRHGMAWYKAFSTTVFELVVVVPSQRWTVSKSNYL